MTFFPSTVQFNVIKGWWTDGYGQSIRPDTPVTSLLTDTQATGDFILKDGSSVQAKISLTTEERDQIVTILDKAADRVKAQIVAEAAASVAAPLPPPTPPTTPVAPATTTTTTTPVAAK